MTAPRSTRRLPVPVGQKFGQRIVLSEAPSLPDKWETRVYVQCDCGRIGIAKLSRLKHGEAQSCQPCARSKGRPTHGKTNTPEFPIWTQMRYRCRSPHYHGFEDYGGRGIKVCERWNRSFEAFLADMGPRPSDQHTVERKDTNGDYCPENCCWATHDEQQNNKRNSRHLEYNGRSMTITQWAREIGIGKTTLFARLRQGWPVERALTEPLEIHRRR